jgi:hypothetical protein
LAFGTFCSGFIMIGFAMSVCRQAWILKRL